MSMSIFDLYLQPKAPPAPIHAPYIYHSRNQATVPQTPDSLRWVDSPEAAYQTLTYCASEQDLGHLSSFMTESTQPAETNGPGQHRKQVSLTHMGTSIPTLEVDVPPGLHKPKRAVRRESNSISVTYSYAENRRYWNDVQKQTLQTRPTRIRRKHLINRSNFPKPLPPISLDKPLIQPSLYLNKLQMIKFTTPAKKEEALASLGFSKRMQETKTRLEVSLLKLDSSVQHMRTTSTKVAVHEQVLKPELIRKETSSKKLWSEERKKMEELKVNIRERVTEMVRKSRLPPSLVLKQLKR